MLGFREVDLNDAEKILQWRTSDRVTRNMNTDIDNTLEQQKRWLSAKRKDESYYHWIITTGDRDIGLVSLSDIDIESKTASWGFYIGDDESIGFGGFVPLFLYDFAFRKLGLSKIVAETLYYNTHVIQLHVQHGYSFRPERDHVITKNQKPVLVVSMELNRGDFIGSRYDKVSADFPVEHWTGNPFK